MREALQILTDELKRLKADGVKSVSVTDETLATLRNVVRKESEAANANRGPVKPAAPTATVAPADSSVPLTASWTPPAAAKPAVRAPQPAAPKATLPPPASFTLPEGDKATRWAWLRDRVLSDPVCNAHVRPGKKVVFGVGNIDAKIMFVGEAPGAEEEVQGEPFVGPAGQLLTKMIAATGLKREEVYIGNIMNWRPELPLGPSGKQYENRPPTAEEMNYCLPYLKAQIEIIQPIVLVALGATAAKGLLGIDKVRTLGEVRGRWHEYQGRPLMVTYHPSYLLRKESESKLGEQRAKRTAWEDFLLVMERANLPISPRQRGYFLAK